MRNKFIAVMLMAISLSLPAVPGFASADGCDHLAVERGMDGDAYFGTHIAGLHAALKLTSAQESGWIDFTSKMKPDVRNRVPHQNWKAMSTPDRLDAILDRMKARENSLAGRVDAVRTFYAILTPVQQKIFDHRFMAYLRNHGRHAHAKNKAA